MLQAPPRRVDVLEVLLTLPFDAEWVAQAEAVDPQVRVHVHPAATVTDVPPELLARACVLYTDRVLPTPAQAPALRWVQLDTAGVDHVVGTELWHSPVPVTTLAGLSARPTAEYVLAVVLGHAHHFPRLAQLQRERRWPPRHERWTQLMPHRLAGATVGVVGYGRIGSEVGRLATAFDLRVLGVRRGGGLPPAGDGVRILGPDGLPELLATADYVVLTTPYTPATHHLLDARALAAMRPGAVVVNVSRGGVVDEAALLDALDTGHVGFAALDVFADEPLPPASPLWTHPRVLVSPHVAGFAPAYRDWVGELFRDNLARLIDGRPLRNVADRAGGY